MSGLRAGGGAALEIALETTSFAHFPLCVELGQEGLDSISGNFRIHGSRLKRGSETATRPGVGRCNPRITIEAAMLRVRRVSCSSGIHAKYKHALQPVKRQNKMTAHKLSTEESD